MRQPGQGNRTRSKEKMSSPRARYRNEAFLKRLGGAIKIVRVSKGYSIDRLYLESGLSRATISHMERGMIDPQASTLNRYAEAIGVTISFLLRMTPLKGVLPARILPR